MKEFIAQKRKKKKKKRKKENEIMSIEHYSYNTFKIKIQSHQGLSLLYTTKNKVSIA